METHFFSSFLIKRLDLSIYFQLSQQVSMSVPNPLSAVFSLYFSVYSSTPITI